MLVALNVVTFQSGWLACVLGAAHDQAWAGAAVALAIAGAWIARSPQPRNELLLAAVAVATGLALDSALAGSGWIVFASAAPLAFLAPPWMLALWALFASTINVSLRRLRDWPGLGAVFGLLGGPVAYYAGAQLGALRLEDPVAGLAGVALGWTIATPLLLVAARLLEAR